MKFWTIFLGISALTTLGQAQTVRVGVFDKPSVVVAYYRSPMWAETIGARKAELEAARRAQNQDRVKELEEWGSHQQEVAHRQLEGDAPLTNILEALKPAFAAVAHQSQLALVVGDMPHAGPMIVPVDITEQLMDWLKADDRTRSMAKDVRLKGSGKH